MQSKIIHINQEFIGREHEREALIQIGKKNEAAIVVMYGRRRVGKTELLEQVYANRNILKFEGIANKTEQEQRELVLRQLAAYADEPLLKKLKVDSWLEVFEEINCYVKEGLWTLYFEELQWLACYENNFINELKYYWDNFFRHNRQLLVILCGSSPSFMINQVMHSKALYNRTQHEFALEQFNLIESKELLGNRANRDVMNAYLTVGGIPEYLRVIKDSPSLQIGLCKNSFMPKSYFRQEYDRIFVSSLVDNPHYKAIVNFLADRAFASREEILKHLKLSSSGYITKILTDIELCGFIKRYVPYNLKENSMLARYAINDPYIQYYIQFINPVKNLIDDGRFSKNPVAALKQETYYRWLGFAFERFCRRYHFIIASMLGFSAVNYRSGVFFNKSTNKDDPNYQIDLIFDRDDHVLTICEIKYLQGKVNTSIIESFERKLSYLPDRDKKTIHKVLITTVGITDSLQQQAYFDRVILLDELFEKRNWE